MIRGKERSNQVVVEAKIMCR